MFKDERRDKVWNEIRQHELRSFKEMLPPEVFEQAAQAAGVKLGCSALNLANLVWLGIASAIDRTKNFAWVLTITLKILEDVVGFESTTLGRQQKSQRKGGKDRRRRRKKSKHDPYGSNPTKVSEEAFVQARQRMPIEFWTSLVLILVKRFQQDHGEYSQFRGFRLLAMDGTTFVLPKSEALYRHYGSQKNGRRKKANPQARMVMMSLPGTRIPIAYEVSPLKVSELTLAHRLVTTLQANDLLLLDRGFISYGLFWEIQQKSAFFGIRLKAGLNLKKVRKLGRDDTLYDWKPTDSRGKWKHLEKSLRVRVIRYKFRGFRASGIITNVLDPACLSREDWVQMATDCDDCGMFRPGLYHRRWEIETSFCELKSVMDTSSLRSLTPQSVEYELNGRIVYYLLLRWLMVKAAKQHGLDPLRISFTNALRELETMRHTLITATPQRVHQVLLPRLLDRIASHLVPIRPGRHYPRRLDSPAKIQRRRQKTNHPKTRTRANSHNPASNKCRSTKDRRCKGNQRRRAKA